MRTIRLTLLGMALSCSAVAQAQSTYGANFTLDSYLPFRNSPVVPEETPRVGDWVGYSRADGFVLTQDLAEIDPESGAPVWGDGYASAGLNHRSGGPTGTFGDGMTRNACCGLQTIGDAQLGWNSVSAQVSLSGPAGKGTAYAVWSQGFNLDPHASFTFSGLGRLSISDPNAEPLNAITEFSGSAAESFASLVRYDVGDRVGVQVAVLLAAGDLYGGAFSHATSPDGLMSLTVTNTSDQILGGALTVRSWVNVVAAPVPEPSTLMCMAFGLALVAGAARKKRGQASRPAFQ